MKYQLHKQASKQARTRTTRERESGREDAEEKWNAQLKVLNGNGRKIFPHALPKFTQLNITTVTVCVCVCALMCTIKGIISKKSVTRCLILYVCYSLSRYDCKFN